MQAYWRWLVFAAFGLLWFGSTSDVHAQSEGYPSKPVRIVVDSAAGSANDATARILADKLGKIWNQQVLTLNQPGAGGSLSARVAATSPVDGLTLYMPATSPFLASLKLSERLRIVPDRSVTAAVGAALVAVL